MKSAITAQLAQLPLTGDTFVDQARGYGAILDGVEVAMCAFDLQDRTVAWNRTFLRCFPEHDGHVHEGEHYADNLRRFYRARLDAQELEKIEEYVRAGIERHQAQTQPFEFEHRGVRLQVSSLPVASRGRVRVWRAVAGTESSPMGLVPRGGLLEEVPEALLACDADGLIAWANAACRELFRLPDGDTPQGLSIETAFDAAWSRTAPREEERRDRGKAVLREHLRYPGAPFELPLPGDRLCRVTARPTNTGGTIFALTDVSALKLYEEALHLTLDNAGRGIIRYDAEGQVVLYNRDALRLLDLPEELLSSLPRFTDVVQFQRDRGDFDVAGEPWMTTGTGTGMGPDHYLRRTRDGRVLEIATRTLPDGGGVRTYADVTAYVQAQQALRQQTEALELTLESMGQGLSAIDAQGRLVLWNRRYRELLDLPESLLASQPTMEQVVRFQIERGDFGPNFEYVDAVARGYVAVGDKLGALQGPETYVRRTVDGRTFEVSTRPLPAGGAVRTFTDVTALLQAQEVLAQKQAQLGAILHTLPDRVWLKDRDGVYLLSNPAHQKFYGRTEAEILGRTDTDLVGAPVAAQRKVTDLHAMEAQGPLVFEESSTAEDGGRVHAEIVKVAMRDEEGRCTGMLGIARDITARKEAEAGLIAAKEEALRASSAKSRFLSSMSHEIRTPMNAILGMLTLLRGTGLSDRQADYSAKAESAARSLLSLLNDILDFSKIEAGKMTLDSREFSLEKMFGDLAVILSSSLGDRKLEILYDLDPTVPDRLVGDDMRLRQILINLGGNALKFTEHGEVVLSTRLVQEGGGQATIEFSVQDSGIGMDAEQQARLFSDYMQASNETSRRFGGTGLGLGICRRLTELMHSELQVESTPGEGSRFWFTVTLPMGTSAVAAAPAVQAARHVLVVDDNQLARETLANICRGAGWKVDIASDGKEALARVVGTAARGEAYDAVFVDWTMPGLDGWQTCMRIRTLVPGRVPLVIMVTATGRDQLERLPAEEQSLLDGYLVKPVTPGMLRAAVEGSGPPDTLSPPESTATPLRGLRVLLAEDNPVNQQIAAELLARQGADVQVVADGIEALEQLQSQPLPDVVLMDVQMPRMDGLAATRALRERWDAQELPVIAMTANAMESDRLECIAAGMNDHVGKPFVLEHVVQTILAHTGRAADFTLAARTPRTAAPDIAVFDRQAALEQLGGDAELLDRALEIFVRNLEQARTHLREGGTPLPHEELVRLVHSLKGSAGTVGAQALAQAAKLAEHALNEGQEARELLRDVLHAIDALLPVLAAPGSRAQ